MLRALIAVCLVMALPSVVSSGDVVTTGSEIVSMIQLIATPEKYDGKSVAVVGFLKWEFEGHILYLHREDYESGITKNGLWVSSESKVDEFKNLDEQYIMLAGKFNARYKGHMSNASGSIGQITHVAPWPPQTARK